MNKWLAGLALSALSLAAFAVTFSIDLTAGEATRVAAELGKARNLTDGAGAPRAATAAEVKGYIADTLRTLVLQGEREARQKAKLAEVIEPTPIDPK